MSAYLKHAGIAESTGLVPEVHLGEMSKHTCQVPEHSRSLQDWPSVKNRNNSLSREEGGDHETLDREARL